MILRIPAASTAERLTITPAASELIYDETLKQVYVGDGVTVGGLSLAMSGGGGEFSGGYVSSVNGMSGDVTITEPDFFYADAVALSGAIVALIPSVSAYATLSLVSDVSAALHSEIVTTSGSLATLVANTSAGLYNEIVTTSGSLVTLVANTSATLESQIRTISGSYVNLSTSQSISGIKTFESEIRASYGDGYAKLTSTSLTLGASRAASGDTSIIFFGADLVFPAAYIFKNASTNDLTIANIDGGTTVLQGSVKLTGATSGSPTVSLARDSTGKVVTTKLADFFVADAVSLSGNLVTVSETMSANALYQANAYTDAASAYLYGVIQSTSGGGGISGGYVSSVNGMSGDVTITEPDFFYADAVALSGAIVAQIPSLSGYATISLVESTSAILESHINAISVESSGGTILVNHSGSTFNVEVADYISKTEVANMSGSLALDANVVHKSGTETISGLKYFTGLLAAGNTADGYSTITKTAITIGTSVPISGNRALNFVYDGNNPATSTTNIKLSPSEKELQFITNTPGMKANIAMPLKLGSVTNGTATNALSIDVSGNVVRTQSADFFYSDAAAMSGAVLDQANAYTDALSAAIEDEYIRYGQPGAFAGQQLMSETVANTTVVQQNYGGEVIALGDNSTVSTLKLSVAKRDYDGYVNGIEVTSSNTEVKNTLKLTEFVGVSGNIMTTNISGVVVDSGVAISSITGGGGMTAPYVTTVNGVSGAVTIPVADFFASDAVALSGNVITASAAMSANALAQANSYTDIKANTLKKSQFGVTVDGGDSTPTSGSLGYWSAPCSGTIVSWYMFADVAGSAVIDIKKNGSIISSTDKPTLSSATSASDTSLSWGGFAEHDTIEFVLNSASTLKRINLVINYTKEE